MTTNIYSNAFNFSSYLNGSVDLRTGQYSAVIKLATIRSSSSIESTRDISLIFNMMNTNNEGFGKGWSLGKSEYNTANSTLQLLSGGTFRSESMPPEGYSFRFKDKKIKDILVKKIANDRIEIIYKDGIIEILQRINPSSNYKTYEIIFENGEIYRFYYTPNEQLQRIANVQANKDMLNFEYSNNLLQKSHTLIENNKKSTIAYSYQNNLLISVTVPYDANINQPNPSAFYKYEYQTFSTSGFTAIRRITNPLGGQEFITYRENGHNFDNNTYIPFVSQWENNPAAGQPSTVKIYSYSQGQNFLGYPFSGGGFLPYEDNLYLKVGDYEYWTEEKTIEPNNETIVYESIKTIYNKFHLLKEEILQRGHAQTIKEITYNEIAGRLFPEQPANLQNPKKIVTRYKLLSTGVSREEVTHIETDDYGNTLSQIEKSGIKYQYSFYPQTGEGSNCPPDPFNAFSRFLKQEMIIPVNNDGPTKTTNHTYAKLAINGSKEYFVIRNKEIVNNIVTTEFIYNDMKSNLSLHGRLKTSILRMNNQISTTQFSYSFNGDNLTETRRVSVSDGTWSESTRHLSLMTNRLKSIQKADKTSTIVMEYDIHGRIISEVVSPGTAYEAKRFYSYQFASANEPAKLISTDALGKRTVTRYDGLGRPISLAELQNNNSDKIVKTLHYNRLDQLIEEVIIDNFNVRDVKLSTQYTYNSWGKLSHIRNPDGSAYISEENPLENTKTEGVLGGNRTETHFNKFGQIEKVTEIGTNNERIQTQVRTYDGLGRCKSDKDINGHTVYYTYDIFDRLIQAQTIPANNSAPARTIKSEFVEYTTSSLAKRVSVDNKVVGTRTYDGIGRLITENKGGGQTSRFEYSADSFLPTASLSPRGYWKNLNYNLELSALSRFEIENQSTNFEYHTISGNMTKAQNINSTRHIEYDDWQRPSKEIISLNGRNYESGYVYSPAGRLLRFESSLGDTENRVYDNYGRLEKISANNFNVFCYYDNLGRMNRVTVHEGHFQVETTLSFDNFGRESIRSLRRDGALLQTISLSYYPNGQISQRKIGDARGNTLCDEIFYYDAYRRLISYQCNGAEFPLDSHGRKIKKQDFTFDSLDNITSVKTQFMDNSENICTRTFSQENPTQLVQVSYSNPFSQHVLQYDASGNLLSDHKGHEFQYDGLERMISTSLAGNRLCEYRYDAQGRQISQIVVNQDPLHLHYFNNQLIGETQGSSKLRYLIDNNKILGRKIEQSGESSSEINILDDAGSVKKVISTNTVDNSLRLYTPYGECNNNKADSTEPLIKRHNIGFNGSRLDPITNLYHLGNGQRAYSPELMVFLSPDPLSPFGKGGLNSYSYCNGDPINNQDPSGLFWSMFKKVLGLAVSLVILGIAIAAAVPTGGASLSILAVVGAIGAGLGVVASTLDVAAEGISMVDKKYGSDNSNHIRNLNIAAFSFGVASAVLSVGSSARGVAKTALGRTKVYDLNRMAKVDLYRSGNLPVSFSMSYAKTVYTSVKLGIPHIGTIMRYGPLVNQIASTAYKIQSLTNRGLDLFADTSANTQHDSNSYASGSGEGYMSPTNGFSDIIERNLNFSDELEQQASNIRSSAANDLYATSI
ncbi:RHS repeat domain-containing protein [Fluviispira vulneris]|uniref:RHS repeat domain-containing protein n=1 Tax=Fluviispira vulneris TaxID=2763012 RepID=UPI001647B875|nr:RHS repeat-associated core domain-containing protein [Fluviispira vulneris]